MFSFPEAAKALQIHLHRANPLCYGTGAAIDSRKVQPGDLFAALEGDRSDGHQFMDDAFRAGASGAIIRKDFFETNRERLLSDNLYQNLLVGPHPETMLQELAAWHRARFPVRVIGITGSVGKTSTKEFLFYLMRSQFPTLANAGNLNNHLGVPLTLLQLTSDARYCLVEMGANHRGEIRFLSSMARPDAGIITKVSPAHLEGFGSIENIYEAKCELMESLPSSGMMVLPFDDKNLLKRARGLGLKVITVGESKEADFAVTGAWLKDGCVWFSINESRTFSFPGVAKFQVGNAACAVATACSLGIRLEDLPERWTGMKFPAGRFEEKVIQGDIRVIFDGYNASPEAFQKALETFSELEATGRKILIFSDMLELGFASESFHEALAEQIARQGFDYIGAYGPYSAGSIRKIQEMMPSLEAEHFKSSDDLGAALKNRVRSGDVILLKASRGMKIENVLGHLDTSAVV
ncbi:MAG: UDP-N-acetylmuramoyl-tripeptide--D-alanyl-D-alanine ligase [Candidatus Omnitrophica bacterium]|nr:UDP-N-acetylmuramoyl-tripeptide--D-alanyl-D-alanine ligase [Candidatus Omnitrophota bacterium]